MIAEISTLKRVCCEPLERIENYAERKAHGFSRGMMKTLAK